jgi:hypothetical protein
MRTLARARDKSAIVLRLRTVRADSPRQWGRMSAHQMVCHLGDALGMALGQRSVSHSASLVQRTLVKLIALYLPLPWPRGVLETSPELDQERGGTKPGPFADDLARAVALLELLTTLSNGFAWPAHPIFGSMSNAAWLRWAYLHTDHHLRQFGS